MIKAVIDMGTNTFNLLIARLENATFETLLTTKEGVALGMGGINEKRIAKDAWERALLCLKRYRHYCEKWEAEKIVLVATSAIRDAENSREFIQEVEKIMHFPVHCIDGKTEAELIFHGVACSYSFSSTTLIMDIGGGSTEFIEADRQGILQMDSFDIGVSRVYQKFDFSDPLSNADIHVLETFLAEKMGNFLKTTKASVLVGASGSFESLYELIYKLPFPKGVEPVELEINQLYPYLEKLIHSTLAERDANKHILPIRRKMMHIAAVKIRWVLNQTNIQRVMVSPCSIKEGALIQL